jgi:anaerobic selenocysteine-containing dehydrogenase
VAGNPLISIAGGDRLHKALEQLELLVCIDLYRTTTGVLADSVLPSTDMLERDDLNVCGIGLSHRPFAQYTPAVVEPLEERRTEHWICHRILQELGQPSDLDDADADRWGKWRYMLKRGSDIDLADLMADPQPVALPKPEAGPFFDEQIQTEDQKVDCCPATFAEALTNAATIFAELQAEPDGFKLIHRRDSWMMNSWLRNLPRMQKGGRTTNPLWMHPSDAEGRGVRAGDAVRVFNANGVIEAVVDYDDALMPGVVAMSHGWGQAKNPGMSVAQQAPGVNCNVLLPSGPGSFERLSSQAHMTGIPVEVEPISS